jgi:hypothetical protein
MILRKVLVLEGQGRLLLLLKAQKSVDSMGWPVPEWLEFCANET